MKVNINSIYSLMLLIWWVMGSVMAFDKGLGPGICSIVFGPFYSWFLVVKHTMAFTGFYPGV